MDNRDKETKSSNCKEYQALQYKTMINNGTNIDNVIDNETNEEKINHFLETEIASNKKQSWIKLTRTNKFQKLKKYLNEIAVPMYSLNKEEITQCENYFFQCLERKKLHKNNEVFYDENKGIIEGLKSITFDEDKRKFLTNKNFSSSLKNNSKNNQETKKTTQRAKTRKKSKNLKDTKDTK